MKFAVITLLIAACTCRNYDFISERAELLYFNNSFVTNVYFHFGKTNRTFGALNVSFDVVRDFNEKLYAALKSYLFYHNEYRYTGFQMNGDLCKIEKSSHFSVKEQLRSAQLNISLCPIKKGSYKLVNFAPQAKYFPPNLPQAKVRANVRLHDGQGANLFVTNWYFELKSIVTKR